MEKKINVDVLSANADKRETFTFFHKFTTGERNEHNELFSVKSIELDEMEVKKTEFMERFKADTKPVKLEMKQMIDESKQGGRFVTDNCFVIIDHDENSVGYYNTAGALIHTRSIRPDEMQKSIFTLKTGTNES